MWFLHLSLLSQTCSPKVIRFKNYICPLLNPKANKLYQNQPQSKAGNPHHSNGAYKHAAHSPSLSGTSSHKSTLESREPVQNSVRIPHLTDIINIAYNDKDEGREHYTSRKQATNTCFFKLPHLHDFVTTVLHVSMQGPRWHLSGHLWKPQLKSLSQVAPHNGTATSHGVPSYTLLPQGQVLLP